MTTSRRVSFEWMSPFRDSPAPRPRIAIDRDWRTAHKAIAFLAGAAAVSGGAFLVRALPSSSDLMNVPDVRVLVTSPRPLGLVRVKGDLVPGTFVRTATPCEHRFALETDGFRIPVKLTSCVLSDPFEAAVKDEEPTSIIVDGELGADGFTASSAIAQVPSCCYCSTEQRAAARKAWRASRRERPPK